MAYISFKPSDYFNAKTYTGNGSTQTITNNVDSDLVWLKTTGSDNHVLFDSVRGTNKKLHSDTNAAEGTSTAPNLGVTAFNSTSFDLGAWSAVNGSGTLYSSYAWKAGTTSGIATNGSTTITPSAYSFNQTSGFSVVKYTGNGTSGAKIAHGLNATPDIVIVKRTGSTGSWDIINKHVGATYYMRLDNSNAKATGTWAFNDTLPDSVNFTVGDNAETNSSDGNVAYCFAPVKGFSQFGNYTGNGNADGTFVHTGFEPELIICKNRDSGGPAAYGWTMISNSFGMTGATTADPSFNELTQSFFADQNTAVATGNAVDFLSNGFKWRSTGTGGNQSAAPFVYMAFARKPIVGSNGTTGVAR